jgi:cytidylate kinase
MYRVVTVAREYGSGGGPIAAKLAERLGWELLDNALIMRVATAANVAPSVCRDCDERVDGWFHRLNKHTFGRGAFERVGAGDVFDADAMVEISRKMIEKAAEDGNAVIVGRAAQCVLQGRSDVFHVFVYAPMDERIRRVRDALGSAFATPARIMEQDRIRSHYVHHYYRSDWRDPHVYDALFCSLIGEDQIVNMIMRGMGIEERTPLHAD